MILLSIGLPVLVGGGVFAYLASTGAFAPHEPPVLSAAQQAAITAEFDERTDLIEQLDAKRAEYRTALSEWNTSEQWADDLRTDTGQPTPAVANPGGTTMPGGDPLGRAFLDSIGATDVTVAFEAGPDNCGYSSTQHDPNYVYSGGCFRDDYPNTLYMAWDDGAEDGVWSIFVHEAAHWYQSEHYAQATFLADYAGIAFDSYRDSWEADASCRAVYVWGMSLDDYEDGSSPCTVDGWYEGWIADFLTAKGARLTEPEPTSFEPMESSRP